MSNLSVNTITDASGGSTASINGLTPQASNMQPHNLIINGAMTISQRGTSFAGLTNGNAGFTLDRWRFGYSGNTTTGVFTITQDTDSPDGFASSLKLECTTAQATFAAGDANHMDYYVEAQDIQHLNYGSSAALATTISFWVKSNKTGTYALWVYQPDAVRHCQVQYTIDVADTWEKKTGIIPADITGVINNDNGNGLYLRFALGAGTNWTSGTAPTAWEANVNANRYVGHTVNLADNTSNYWNITGVQLEAGSTASSFAHENYGDTLQKCQRYFTTSYTGAVPTVNNIVGAVAYYLGGGAALFHCPFQTKMRAAPSVTTYSYNGTSGAIGGASNAVLTASVFQIGLGGFNVYATGNGGSDFYCNYAASAEL